MVAHSPSALVFLCIFYGLKPYAIRDLIGMIFPVHGNGLDAVAASSRRPQR